MPKLRQKSCSQARKAKTALMRQKREADRRIDISDRYMNTSMSLIPFSAYSCILAFFYLLDFKNDFLRKP